MSQTNYVQFKMITMSSTSLSLFNISWNLKEIFFSNKANTILHNEHFVSLKVSEIYLRLC